MEKANTNAAPRLLPLVYRQLRALAGRYMRAERPDHTLQPTALVHEAYVRLAGTDGIDWQGKTHFFSIAATQMRRVLVEHARSHNAGKRGGGAARVSLGDAGAVSEEGVIDLLSLDEALDRLALVSERQARVVELRYFAGLSIEETARTLDVSVGTVKGDWRLARAWLTRALGAR